MIQDWKLAIHYTTGKWTLKQVVKVVVQSFILISKRTTIATLQIRLLYSVIEQVQSHLHG